MSGRDQQDSPRDAGHAPPPGPPPDPAGRPAHAAMTELPVTLLRAYGEICTVLHGLRQGRDALEKAMVERLHHTSVKLREVSSATELAATDMLDGLDRASSLVDALDALDTSTDSPTRELRAQLRDELFKVICCVQFQDITNQQLHHASSILVDMEQRLEDVARIFDPGTIGVVHPSPSPVQKPFDPCASLAGADDRQALVDSILGSRG